MSLAIFQPTRVGPLSLRNKFVRSATSEGLCDIEGNPTKKLADMMINLAKGECGLIVTGLVAVNSASRVSERQTLMFTNSHVAAWKPIIESVHSHGSKILFQSCHAGLRLQPGAIKGYSAKGPVAAQEGSFAMTNTEIEELIDSFINSAKYSALAGVDGVQLHACHGFLLSQWLSPAVNKRTDKWGGSVENRVRLIREIAEGIRKATPENFSLSIKLHGDDCVPGGVDVRMCCDYINLLKDTMDFFEISCGMNTNKVYAIRSNLDEKVMTKGIKPEMKDKMFAMMKSRSADYEDEYNKPLLEYVRKVHPNVKLVSVGGNREINAMNKQVTSGLADLVAMSRPFVRDPFVVKKLREGTLTRVECVSCGGCIFRSNGTLFCHNPN